MVRPPVEQDRRSFLGQLAFGVVAFSGPVALAEALIQTPASTEGPFYPDRLPLDTDNDLLILNDSLSPAVGEITHLTGRVLSAAGEPIRNATVEIWQTDANGVYIHSQSAGRDQYDTNFQGFGRFITGTKGDYYFRTIKPVQYGFRTPHIHVAVYMENRRVLTTQFYNRAEPSNKKDMLVRRIRDPQALATVMVDFKPIPESIIGEFAANCDIVLGMTPREPDHE